MQGARLISGKRKTETDQGLCGGRLIQSHHESVCKNGAKTVAEFIQVITSGGEFVLSVLVLLKVLFAQYWALILWVVFWLFLVRWPDLRPQLRTGGWAGFLLLYFIVSLVWGLTTEAYWSYFGVTLPSVLEKSLLAAVWVGLAFLCGWLQDLWHQSPQEIEILGPPDGLPAVAGHGGHGGGHDDHHGHGGHGHGHEDNHHH